MRNILNNGSLKSMIRSHRNIGQWIIVILVIILTFFVYASSPAKENDPVSLQNKEELGTLTQDKDFARIVDELNLENGTKEVSTPKAVTVEENQSQALYKAVEKELKGTRMEPMIEYIAQQDPNTAALLVGIAKIESGYTHNYHNNFWGYAGGRFAFESPKKAVETVSKRLKELQADGLTTPSEIVYIWKCGGNCSSHAPGSVGRWVSTASGPFNRIINANSL